MTPEVVAKELVAPKPGLEVTLFELAVMPTATPTAMAVAARMEPATESAIHSLPANISCGVLATQQSSS